MSALRFRDQVKIVLLFLKLLMPFTLSEISLKDIILTRSNSGTTEAINQQNKSH